VAKHIDEIQLSEMNKNLQQAIASNDQEEARRAAQSIEKKAEVMGRRAAKKTMLAKQVLQELNAGGRVSKKTQLAMDDAARLVEETPLT
jgi:predicted nucleic acid-binding protein